MFSFFKVVEQMGGIGGNGAGSGYGGNVGSTVSASGGINAYESFGKKKRKRIRESRKVIFETMFTWLKQI